MPEISVRLNLDMSAVAQQFDTITTKFQQRVDSMKQAAGVDRGTQLQEQGYEQAYRKRLQMKRADEIASRRQFNEDQRRGRANLVVMDRQLRAEEAAMRRSYQLRLAEAKKNQREMEMAKNRRIDYEDRVEAERKRRREGMVGGALGRAGRAAQYGSAVVGGLVANGFRGTAEGGRFSAEVSMISREAANIAKPIMDATNRLLANVRGGLQELSPTARERILNYGSSGALAIGAASMFPGTAGTIAKYGVGAAALGIGYGARGLAAGVGAVGVPTAGLLAGAGYAAYQGYSATGGAGRIEESLTNKVTPRDIDNAGYSGWRGMDRNSLKKKIDQEASVLRESQSRIDAQMAKGEGRLRYQNINPFADGPGLATLDQNQSEVNRRMSALVEMRHKMSVPGKRADSVLDVSMTGFGGVGSTAEAMQEQVFKQGVGVDGKIEGGAGSDPMSQLINVLNDLVTYLRTGGNGNAPQAMKLPPAQK